MHRTVAVRNPHNSSRFTLLSYFPPPPPPLLLRPPIPALQLLNSGSSIAYTTLLFTFAVS